MDVMMVSDLFDADGLEALLLLKSGDDGSLSFILEGTVQVKDARWIWRMEVNPQMSLFLRKVAWDWLSTRSMLRARGMKIQPTYLCCELEEQMIEHILLLCLKVRQVWHLTDLHQYFLQTAALTEAFLEYLCRSAEGAISDVVACYAAYIAYHIWPTRNGLLFAFRRSSIKFILEAMCNTLSQ
ncbi:uncharacterized protein [Elaeis guineensis]|uniref:uncharacterized protein n=1 Tax=Elaeis guineensis var. tenera TaxID=51953 RepID=UPI003C6D98BB